MIKVYLFFIFLLLPTMVFGDSETEGIHKYLKKLETTKTAIFYSACQLKEGGKASLVFPVGEKQGAYIETSGNMVANSAVVILKEGTWDMEDAGGGLYTVKVVTSLVSELLTYPFELIMPENIIKHIDTGKPKKKCVEKLPE
jgi:hypothetical protein